MAHAETLAREHGFDTIRLYTNQRFVENIELYRKLGYVVDREEVVPVGVVTHMSKRL
jgi:ribosomal protein S18 acetylase RimI-like enzyme